jgi:hypothetical protein
LVKPLPTMCPLQYQRFDTRSARLGLILEDLDAFAGAPCGLLPPLSAGCVTGAGRGGGGAPAPRARPPSPHSAPAAYLARTLRAHAGDVAARHAGPLGKGHPFVNIVTASVDRLTWLTPTKGRPAASLAGGGGGSGATEAAAVQGGMGGVSSAGALSIDQDLRMVGQVSRGTGLVPGAEEGGGGAWVGG